jgi:hypothetical protein
MEELVPFLAYLLSASGLTVLLVWPQTGPSAWLRERILRRVLIGRLGEFLDCYICSGFWCGLLLSPLWWLFRHQLWCWSGCLAVPFLFWLALRRDR